MSVILILILASLGMALLFLGGFIWAVRSGQFDDTHTPALRVLTEEDSARPAGAPAPVRETFREAGGNAAPRSALRPADSTGQSNET